MALAEEVGHRETLLRVAERPLGRGVGHGNVDRQWARWLAAMEVGRDSSQSSKVTSYIDCQSDDGRGPTVGWLRLGLGAGRAGGRAQWDVEQLAAIEMGHWRMLEDRLKPPVKCRLPVGYRS